jgi:hypothetical protein
MTSDRWQRIEPAGFPFLKSPRWRPPRRYSAPPLDQSCVGHQMGAYQVIALVGAGRESMGPRRERQTFEWLKRAGEERLVGGLGSTAIKVDPSWGSAAVRHAFRRSAAPHELGALKT